MIHKVAYFGSELLSAQRSISMQQNVLTGMLIKPLVGCTKDRSNVCLHQDCNRGGRGGGGRCVVARGGRGIDDC